jgi:hypothetical protein
LTTYRTAIFCFLALSACEQMPEHKQSSDVPKELAELRQDAFNCWLDSDQVPVENSEHCVFVAEHFFEAFRDECEKSQRYECINYNAHLGNIGDIYKSAIIEGLVKFGRPEWIDNAEKDHAFAGNAYFDGKLMRRLFEACLAKERLGLRRNGLQPAMTITRVPLAEGQQCVRRGYPEFKTEPLNQS